jgi:hypothetical protein
MKLFVVSANQAALGLPFYVAWNLVAYTREQHGLGAKVKTACLAVPLAVVFTGLWAAPTLIAAWLMLR